MIALKNPGPYVSICKVCDAPHVEQVIKFTNNNDNTVSIALCAKCLVDLQDKVKHYKRTPGRITIQEAPHGGNE